MILKRFITKLLSQVKLNTKLVLLVDEQAIKEFGVYAAGSNELFCIDVEKVNLRLGLTDINYDYAGESYDILYFRKFAYISSLKGKNSLLPDSRFPQNIIEEIKSNPASIIYIVYDSQELGTVAFTSFLLDGYKEFDLKFFIDNIDKSSILEVAYIMWMSQKIKQLEYPIIHPPLG